MGQLQKYNRSCWSSCAPLSCRRLCLASSVGAPCPCIIINFLDSLNIMVQIGGSFISFLLLIKFFTLFHSLDLSIQQTSYPPDYPQEPDSTTLSISLPRSKATAPTEGTSRSGGEKGPRYLTAGSLTSCITWRPPSWARGGTMPGSLTRGPQQSQTLSGRARAVSRCHCWSYWS